MFSEKDISSSKELVRKSWGFWEEKFFCVIYIYTKKFLNVFVCELFKHKKRCKEYRKRSSKLFCSNSSLR